MVVRSTDDRLSVIQRYANHLGPCFGHACIDQALQSNCAILADGVAEVLFPFGLLSDEVLEAKRAAIGECNKSVSGETSTSTVTFYEIEFGAVSVFAGEGSVKCIFALDEVTSSTGSFASTRGQEALFDDGFGLARSLFQ